MALPNDVVIKLLQAVCPNVQAYTEHQGKRALTWRLKEIADHACAVASFTNKLDDEAHDIQTLWDSTAKILDIHQDSMKFRKTKQDTFHDLTIDIDTLSNHSYLKTVIDLLGGEKVVQALVDFATQEKSESARQKCFEQIGITKTDFKIANILRALLNLSAPTPKLAVAESKQQDAGAASAPKPAQTRGISTQYRNQHGVLFAQTTRQEELPKKSWLENFCCSDQTEEDNRYHSLNHNG